MTIKVGDRLPEGTLQEYIEVEGNGCSVGPNTFKVQDLAKGKKIAIFGLPGAFTPTCSAKHVPGYLALRAFITEAIGRGELRDLDPGVFAHLVGGLALFGGLLIARAGEPETTRATVGEAIELMLRALGPGDG